MAERIKNNSTALANVNFGYNSLSDLVDGAKCLRYKGWTNGVDCNTEIWGIVYCGDGCRNRPNNSLAGFLITLGSSDIVQFYSDFLYQKIYMRTGYNAGSFNSWHQIAFT